VREVILYDFGSIPLPYTGKVWSGINQDWSGGFNERNLQWRRWT